MLFRSRTASARSRCFCASSSVLPGSSFRRLFTSRSCDCVVRISVLTDFKAVVSFVVSPPISTVMPCILDATPPHLPSPNHKKRKPGSSLKKCIKKDTCCFGKCLCKIIYFYLYQLIIHMRFTKKINSCPVTYFLHQLHNPVISLWMYHNT